ncbi:MAG: transcription antitermination factor NusB [Pseudomonadota bacterium]
MPNRRASKRRSNQETNDEAAALTARDAALSVVLAVFDQGRFADDALDEILTAGGSKRAGVRADMPAPAPLSQRDRAFVRRLTATVFRRCGEIDAAYAPYLAQSPPPAPLQALLRLGAAELIFLRTPAYAAVGTWVSVARGSRATERFAKATNAILRRVSERTPAPLSGKDAVSANIPAWLRDRWEARFGAAALTTLGEAVLRDAPLDLGVRSEPEAWAARLDGRVLPMGHVRLTGAGRPVKELAGFRSGAWWVQDIAAGLAARALGDVQGTEVLDLCAAPGGKTAALAARGAQVTAVDASAKRLKRLRENMDRLALQPTIIEADLLTWEPQRRFEAILLDAPCTATGTIRRHPDLMHLRRETDLADRARLQETLLRRSLSWLEPGGRLVYAVCSLEAEEGPKLIARLVAENAVTLLPIEAADIGGLASLIAPEGWVQTRPDLSPFTGEVPKVGAAAAAEGEAGGAEGGMDGFFVAKLGVPSLKPASKST